MLEKNRKGITRIDISLSRHINDELRRVAKDLNFQASQLLRALISGLVQGHPRIQRDLDYIVRLGVNQRSIQPRRVTIQMYVSFAEEFQQYLEGLKHPYKDGTVSAKELLVGLVLWLLESQKEVIQFGMLSLCGEKPNGEKNP